MAYIPLFQYRDTPGPGVDPNAPRKRGARRWLEVAWRDLGKFWLSGALALLATLPYLLGLYFAIASHLLIALLLACMLGGMLAAPFWSALMDVMLRRFRDEPVFWRIDWTRALRRDWRQALLPGALWGLLFGAQFFTLYHLRPGGPGLPLLVLLLAGLIVMTGFVVWMWTQVPLFTLPFPTLVRNTLTLALGHPLPTLGASLLCLAYLAVLLLFSPVSLLLLPLANLWLPLSAALAAIYRSLDEAFDLENSIAALHAKERTESPQAEE